MWHDKNNVYIENKPFRWWKIWYYPHMVVYSIIVDKTKNVRNWGILRNDKRRK